MQEFLDLTFWNNTVFDYLMFAGSLVGSIVILLILKRVLLKRLSAWAKKVPMSMEDIMVRATRKYLLPLMYTGTLYLNIKWLKISHGAAHVIDVITLALVMILGAAFICVLLEFLFSKYLDKKGKAAEKHAIRWIGVLIRIIVWTCTLLLFLENLNIEITALIAGLGIGGIAIAFAAQAVLEDIFSFVSILFDRPFELGDFIAVDDMLGSVEHIGIKTTRIRSLSGEQLIFSNKDLTNSRVSNYKRMESRRVQFNIGVTYDTPNDRLKEIPVIIRMIIEDQKNAKFDRAHFKAFDDFSLDFEVIYHVSSQDYALYMDIQQAINLQIKEAFEERGIRFALPTQKLYVEKR
ncbi:MAG: mechanosensitive ion channel family protein [Christensenellales bacterium]